MGPGCPRWVWGQSLLLLASQGMVGLSRWHYPESHSILSTSSLPVPFPLPTSFSSIDTRAEVARLVVLPWKICQALWVKKVLCAVQQLVIHPFPQHRLGVKDGPSSTPRPETYTLPIPQLTLCPHPPAPARLNSLSQVSCHPLWNKGPVGVTG